MLESYRENSVFRAEFGWMRVVFIPGNIDKFPAAYVLLLKVFRITFNPD